MLRLSASNPACLALMWSHCGESKGPRILPSFEVLFECHVIRAAMCGVENILRKRGMRGKWRSTLFGTLDMPTLLYLGALHNGHASMSAYSPLNSTHPFLHASIVSYFSPRRLSMDVATPSLPGSEFGEGKITFENRCSSSLMQAFVAL